MRSLFRRRPSVPAVVVVGMTLLVSGCGSDGDGGGDGAGDGGPAVLGGGGSDDSLTAMLALLPPMEDDELGVVTVSRWHAAAEAYGVPVPDAGADEDELLDYLTSLTTGDGGLIAGSNLANLDTALSAPTEDQFGFALQQIAADISVGLPPGVLSAARGEFDPDAIAEATRSGPVADDVEEVEVAGVPVLRWREDFDTDFDQINALSPIGSAGRLGLPDDRTLLYAAHDDGIEALVDAQQGGASLADDEDLAAVARALDAQDVLSAQLTLRPGGSDLSYETVGIGFAWDDGGRVVLAYSTGSEADAESLASSLEDLLTSGDTVAGGQPWSELLAEPEIRAEGSVVTVVATAEGPAARWAAFLFRRENLF